MRPNRFEEIIDVAYTLFSEKGFEATSIRDICKATNLTTAGLYHYIKSKEELFYKVEERLYEEFEALFAESKDQRNPQKTIQKFIHDYCRLILTHKDVITIILEKALSEGKGVFARESKKRKQRFFKNLKEMLSQAKKTGAVNNEMDTTVATFVLIAIVNWVSLWFKPRGKIKEEELIDSLSRFFTKGFLESQY